MKTLNLIATALVILSSVSAYPSEREGHGGRILVCANPQNPDAKPRVEILDYFLARERFGLDPQLNEQSGETERQVFVRLMSQLQRLEPARAELYIKRFDEFDSRREFTDREVMNFSDVKTVILKPKDCEFHQVVHQIAPGQNNQLAIVTDVSKKFYITEHFWKLLSDGQRAVIKLHEIIYEDAVLQGETYSDSTMVLNSYLASSSLSTLSDVEWRKVLAAQGFGYHYGKLLIDVPASNDLTTGSGAIRTAYLKKTADTDVNYVVFGDRKIRLSSLWGVQYNDNYEKLPLTFADDGSLKSAYIDPGTSLSFQGSTLTIGDGWSALPPTAKQIIDAGSYEIYSLHAKRTYQGNRITLDPAGNIRAAMLDHSAKVAMATGEIDIAGVITFYENGTLRSASLATLDVPLGNGKATEIMGEALFSPNGHVVGALPHLPTGVLRSQRVRNGKASVTLKEHNPAYFDETGKLKTSGIYSKAVLSEYYISLRPVGGDQLRIELCSLVSQDCRAISKSSSEWSKSQLKRALESTRRRNSFEGSGIFSSVAAGAAWPVEKLWDQKGWAGKTVAAALFLPSFYVGVPVASAAAVVVEPVRFIGHLLRGNRSARNQIVNDQFFYTDQDIEILAEELGKQLDALK